MRAVVSAAVVSVAVARAAARDPQPSRALPASAPVVTAQALLRGGRTLLIEHEGEVYTLRLTRQNKLLLTK